MKLIFISYSSDEPVAKRHLRAAEYCRDVSCEGVPIAPELFFSSCFDQDSFTWSRRSRRFALNLISVCTELRVFCNELTEDILEEISCARKYNIPILFFDANENLLKPETLLLQKHIGLAYRQLLEDSFGLKQSCPFAKDCEKYATKDGQLRLAECFKLNEEDSRNV